MSKPIPPHVQRQVGMVLKDTFDKLRAKYQLSEEELFMLLLAIVHGFGRTGGLDNIRLTTMAVNVFEQLEKQYINQPPEAS